MREPFWNRRSAALKEKARPEAGLLQGPQGAGRAPWNLKSMRRPHSCVRRGRRSGRRRPTETPPLRSVNYGTPAFAVLCAESRTAEPLTAAPRAPTRGYRAIASGAMGVLRKTARGGRPGVIRRCRRRTRSSRTCRRSRPAPRCRSGRRRNSLPGKARLPSRVVNVADDGPVLVMTLPLPRPRPTLTSESGVSRPPAFVRGCPRRRLPR